MIARAELLECPCCSNYGSRKTLMPSGELNEAVDMLGERLFFCTPHPQQIVPTMESRCKEISDLPAMSNVVLTPQPIDTFFPSSCMQVTLLTSY
jgi:hypothetical protein